MRSLTFRWPDHRHPHFGGFGWALAKVGVGVITATTHTHETSVTVDVPEPTAPAGYWVVVYWLHRRSGRWNDYHETEVQMLVPVAEEEPAEPDPDPDPEPPAPDPEEPEEPRWPPPPTDVVAVLRDIHALISWTDQSEGIAWHRIVARQKEGGAWQTKAEVPPGHTSGYALGDGHVFGVQALAGGEQSEIVEATLVGD